MNNYYAQNGEDKWLDKNWNILKLPDRGIIVEVGAADGKDISNSLWLEQTKGWDCLLIEADVRWAQVLYKNRPNSKIEMVVCGKDGQVSFGLESQKHLSGLRRNSKNRIELTSMTLSSILAKHNITNIDILSIDTEGSELEVWSGIGNIRPKIVIIEWLTVGMDSKKAKEDILLRFFSDNYTAITILGSNIILGDNEYLKTVDQVLLSGIQA